MKPQVSNHSPSKSACTLKKVTRAVPRSRSDMRFASQFGNAPRKIFMRPPCEEVQDEAENPLTLVIDASVQAVFILSDRFYDDLRRRQLLAIDKMLSLQGKDHLLVEQVEVLSCLIKAVMDKMSSDQEAFVEYSERLAALLTIASRKVTSQSLNALHTHSVHLRDLYDAIGSVIIFTRTRMVDAAIAVVLTIMEFAKEQVANNSQTDFAVNIISAVTYSSILPSLIDIFLEVFVSANDTFTSLLEILRDYLDFFPACVSTMLQHGLVDKLVDVFDAFAQRSPDITSNRHEKFLISGLFCRICNVDLSVENTRNLITEVFSEKKVVEILLLQFRLYFPAVHDTDRLIRNTYGALFSFLLDLGLQNLQLTTVLLSSGVYHFVLDIAVRPECPISDVRLQMHKLDYTLKCILLKAVATCGKSKFSDDDFDVANVAYALLYYLAPYGENERSFWNRDQFEAIREAAIEVLMEVFPRIVDEFAKQEGGKKVLRLLNGLTNLDTELVCSAKPGDAVHSNLIKELIQFISVMIFLDATDSSIIIDFCVTHDGVYSLIQVLNTATEEVQLMGRNTSAVLIRDVFSILNYSASKEPTVLEVIQSLATPTVIRLFQRRFNFEDLPDQDIARCLFISTATWIAGHDETENQYLMGKCAEKLVSLLGSSTGVLQHDLLKQLESILFKSYRITKYLEYQAGTELIEVICRLWRMHEELHTTLHCVWILIKNTWNVDYVTDRSSLAHGNRPDLVETISAIDIFVLHGVKTSLKRFLAQNKEDDSTVNSFKALTELSSSGAVTTFSEDMAASIVRLGDYGNYVSSLCNEVYREVTGRSALDTSLCREGTEELPSTMPLVRSDSTFQH